MTFSEIVSRFVIDPRKLLEYALDPESPFGRHKALVFERRLGFSKQNATLRQQQIEELAPKAEAVLQRTDQYGQHPRGHRGTRYGGTTSLRSDRLVGRSR